MSAAASAEMIETPPVLNFEEIDYKEIEVEEVSEGPAAGRPPPAPPRARPAGGPEGPAWPPPWRLRRRCPRRPPGLPSPAPSPRTEGPWGLPGCLRLPGRPRTYPGVPFFSGCCGGWHWRTKAVWLGAEVPARLHQTWH